MKITFNDVAGLEEAKEEIQEIVEFLMSGVNSRHAIIDKVRTVLGDDHVKMLNLGHDWLQSYLPFVLQKVSRVHFGLLQPSNIRNSVRMTRGLITELSLAERASGRKSLLILGFPPLNSPNLTDKERQAIVDYIEELDLEAQEFKLEFVGADNDNEASDALIAAA